MLDVDEALAKVVERARPLASFPRPATESLGLTLDEDVLADLDLPPFDKALMDGYAIRDDDLQEGRRSYKVVEEVHAGQVPSRALEPGESSLVMTGAPLPDRAGTVIMHEWTERVGEHVRIVKGDDLAPGRNRLPRGREMRAGDRVLSKGQVLNPVRLGLLAAVGRTIVQVVPSPTVHVLPTGDELVDAGTFPGPGRIRNSNGPMLEALARQEGAEVRSSPVAPDRSEPLREALNVGLQADVLLVTGGVSAGNRDLVPETLESLGVDRVFHKLRLKPGKPLWFGIGPERGGRPGALVFGLPGNPVSSVVGFVLFVKPALARLAGREVDPDPSIEVRLSRSFRHSGDRPTFHPATLWARREGQDRPVATPMDWAGSADLRSVAGSDGFLRFPAGDREYAEGEIVRFLPLG